MKLTTNEASELICPFMEGYDSFIKVGNQDIKNIRCVSNKCMAWVKYYPMDLTSKQGYCIRLVNENRNR